MTIIPLGVTPWNPNDCVVPTEAQSLLDSRAVIAFALTANVNEHGAPSWEPGVSVCIAGPDGKGYWLWNWTDIKAAAIPGLADAIVALQQPVPMSIWKLKQTITYARFPINQDKFAYAQFTTDQDEFVQIDAVLLPSGLVFGFRDPRDSLTKSFDALEEAMEANHHRAIDDLLADQQHPWHAFGTFALPIPPGAQGTAHEVLRITESLRPLLAEWMATQPSDALAPWLADVPFGLPSGEAIRRSLSGR